MADEYKYIETVIPQSFPRSHGNSMIIKKEAVEGHDHQRPKVLWFVKIWIDFILFF